MYIQFNKSLKKSSDNENHEKYSVCKQLHQLTVR